MDFYEACKSDAKQQKMLKVDILLGSLNKKDADSLRKALLDSDVPTRSIKRVLEENKIDCGCWSINAWRKANNVVLQDSRVPKRSARHASV